MASNINRVVLTGNLTRDPELRTTPSGMSVCAMRLAVNTRRKDQSGDWVDRANYFDVVVFGSQGENVSRYMSKGRPVAVDGRLEWSEWETDDGSKRQAVRVIADSVQFLSDGKPNGSGPKEQAPAASGDYGTPSVDTSGFGVPTSSDGLGTPDPTPVPGRPKPPPTPEEDIPF